MNEQYISIWELILLQLFWGSIIYLVGSIVLFLVLRDMVNIKIVLLLLLVQFCISVLLSLIIWKFWIINIDIMIFEFVNLPALFSELTTIPIYYFVLKKKYHKRKIL